MHTTIEAIKADIAAALGYDPKNPPVQIDDKQPAWHAAGATGRMRLPDTSPADRQPVALSTPRPGAIHGSHLSGRVKGRHGVATRITGDCAKPQHNEFRT